MWGALGGSATRCPRTLSEGCCGDSIVEERQQMPQLSISRPHQELGGDAPRHHCLAVVLHEKNLAHAIVKRGIVQVFEGRRVFEHLTTEENLIAGAHTEPDRRRVAEGLERVYAYFPRLRERRIDRGEVRVVDARVDLAVAQRHERGIVRALAVRVPAVDDDAPLPHVAMEVARERGRRGQQHEPRRDRQQMVSAG